MRRASVAPRTDILTLLSLNVERRLGGRNYKAQVGPE